MFWSKCHDACGSSEIIQPISSKTTRDLKNSGNGKLRSHKNKSGSNNNSAADKGTNINAAAGLSVNATSHVPNLMSANATASCLILEQIYNQQILILLPGSPSRQLQDNQVVVEHLRKTSGGARGKSIIRQQQQNETGRQQNNKREQRIGSTGNQIKGANEESGGRNKRKQSNRQQRNDGNDTQNLASTQPSKANLTLQAIKYQAIKAKATSSESH